MIYYTYQGKEKQMNKTTMISDLPIKMQKVIEEKLKTVIFSKCQGLTNEERDTIIDDEMSGRLGDIEELININNLIAKWEDEQC